MPPTIKRVLLICRNVLDEEAPNRRNLSRARDLVIVKCRSIRGSVPLPIEPKPITMGPTPSSQCRWLHESGTYVKITDAGAGLFA